MGNSQTVEGWGIWTWPNLVTAVRMAGIPLFCYLLVATDHYWQAATVLAIGGGTDWVDGQLARRLGQVSKLGKMLDPMVDRLYIMTALLALTYVGVLPGLFTLAVLLREVVLATLVIVLRWHGYPPLQVHFLGKVATTMVFASFPVFVIAYFGGPSFTGATALAWALAWWGLALYWLGAIMYMVQGARLIRSARIEARSVASA
ncbi:CDP-alcohol phosphatidyltransferase family protein [Haloglycomyces albus]|uniref:CDP-alcohol phosphatidyltransferase family protein n=1 Tax=Haloglycomyces albus TaxID=526067 RepID=UPI0004A3F13F|nr:CDP-alcohol phosphatidyltransferase family protein [Haloglycomyces albus]